MTLGQPNQKHIDIKMQILHLLNGINLRDAEQILESIKNELKSHSVLIINPEK